MLRCDTFLNALGGTVDEAFGSLLRRLRLDRQLSQEALAEASRVSARQISELERGRNPTARKETARRLATALGLNDEPRTAFIALALGQTYVRPPLLVTTAAPRSLPRDLSSFTGREQALGRLTEQLESSANGTRLHIISGMPGIGKSALAVRAAHRLAERFPDGQIHIALRGHTPGLVPVEPADALGTVLVAIGVAPALVPPNLDARAALWRDRLADKQVLLVLDDAASSEQVAPFLPGSGDSAVIVTSRRRLTALADVEHHNLDLLTVDAAIALFIRLGGPAAAQASRESLTEVVEMCGRLPLSITLLASQLGHHESWTVAALMREFSSTRNRLELLRLEDVSVATAFDMSYRTLPLEQQQLFRRLGIHPGDSISVATAAALDGTGLDAARQSLRELYAQNLVIEPERDRYILHDLLRQFAHELPMADGEQDAAVERHAHYLVAAAAAANEHLARRHPSSPPPDPNAAFTASLVENVNDRSAALSWFEVERTNVHATAAAAARLSRPDIAIHLASSMHGYLRDAGYWTEALDLHQLALDLAIGAGDREKEAGALTDLGDMLFMTGAYDDAEKTLAEALSLHDGLDDGESQGFILRLLGHVNYERGHNVDAVRCLEQASQHFLADGNEVEASNTLTSLAVVQSAIGQLSASMKNQSIALDLHRRLGNREGEARSLQYLGTVEVETGALADSESHQLQALAIYEELGNVFGSANALNWLGVAQERAGRLAAAEVSQRRALDIYEELGHRMGLSNVLHALGTIRRHQGRHSEALEYLRTAEDGFHELGIVQGEAEVLNTQAEVLNDQNRPTDAIDVLTRALGHALDCTSSPEQARAHESLGLAHLMLGDAGSATIHLRSALDIVDGVDQIRADRLRSLLRDVST